MKRSGLITTKIGMTRLYDDGGVAHPVTVLSVGDCTVIGNRTMEKNGYVANILGMREAKAKHVAKPQAIAAEKAGVKPKLHLNINTGMNRFGIQSKKEFFKIISRLVKENLTLTGIYTHFSSLTTDEDYSQRQKMIFEEYANALPYDWDTCVHVGGGGSLFEDVECDMIRVGMLAYGYGNEHVKPVMAIESEIVDMQYVKAGEHVGYLCGFTAREDMVVATIPLGYADGLPRLLSNNFDVKIALRKARSTGNICMDTFMVDVSHIPVQVGDKVIVMQDASYLAKICKTTPYEIGTNFIKFRGESVIK